LIPPHSFVAKYLRKRKVKFTCTL